MKSWNEIRKAATAFSKRWKNAYDEKSQAQSFLKEFFAVFGVDAVTVATFEHRVKFGDGSQGYADCFRPGTILVEMKSRGKDLDAAYQQAMEYVRSMCNVANVKMLPKPNANAQLETGNIGTGNTSTMATISNAAQAVLDARAAHPGATLAALYDPLTMPPDLVKAHAHLDALVDRAYGFGRDKARPSQPTDADRVALLFNLYAERTSDEQAGT